MSTNPDVLRLARSIAAEFCASEYMTHMTLAGGRDTGDAVRAAVAAIERTKDLSVQFLRADDGLETIAAFERYDHLRQPEKGSTDE